MILQVSKNYSPDIGGVETVVKHYSEFLTNYDDIIVLCANKQKSFRTKIEYIEGIKVYRCASFGTFMSMPISIVFYFYLFFLSRKAKYIHFHEPFPLATIGAFLVPKSKNIFVTWHSDIIKQKVIKKFFEYFQYKLCKKSNTIISTSTYLTDFSKVISKFKDKVITIPLSIKENSYLNKLECKQIINNLPKDYIIFLGRFSYYKGIFVLLDAIELIEENIPFVIIGSDELLKEIEKRIKKSKKNITLIPKFVTEDEKKCLLKNSKFMVFPSIYPSEAFGILQIESMIYGKPVINTNLPTGVPWVSLHNVSGLTVEPFDSISLAKNIQKLYNDTKLYQRLSKGAFERVNTLFITKKTNKKLFDLYFKKKYK